jgi:ABC-type multidrug transport system ATPase subunit
MREMEQMCNRILFLNQGRIIASGTPQEVLRFFDSDDLEAAFLKVARGKTL